MRYIDFVVRVAHRIAPLDVPITENMTSAAVFPVFSRELAKQDFSIIAR